MGGPSTRAQEIHCRLPWRPSKRCMPSCPTQIRSTGRNASRKLTNATYTRGRISSGRKPAPIAPAASKGGDCSRRLAPTTVTATRGMARIRRPSANETWPKRRPTLRGAREITTEPSDALGASQAQFKPGRPRCAAHFVAQSIGAVMPSKRTSRLRRTGPVRPVLAFLANGSRPITAGVTRRTPRLRSAGTAVEFGRRRKWTWPMASPDHVTSWQKSCQGTKVARARLATTRPDASMANQRGPHPARRLLPTTARATQRKHTVATKATTTDVVAGTPRTAATANPAMEGPKSARTATPFPAPPPPGRRVRTQDVIASFAAHSSTTPGNCCISAHATALPVGLSFVVILMPAQRTIRHCGHTRLPRHPAPLRCMGLGRAWKTPT